MVKKQSEGSNPYFELRTRAVDQIKTLIDSFADTVREIFETNYNSDRRVENFMNISPDNGVAPVSLGYRIEPIGTNQLDLTFDFYLNDVQRETTEEGEKLNIIKDSKIHPLYQVSYEIRNEVVKEINAFYDEFDARLERDKTYNHEYANRRNINNDRGMRASLMGFRMTPVNGSKFTITIEFYVDTMDFPLTLDEE